MRYLVLLRANQHPRGVCATAVLGHFPSRLQIYYIYPLALTSSATKENAVPLVNDYLSKLAKIGDRMIFSRLRNYHDVLN